MKRLVFILAVLCLCGPVGLQAQGSSMFIGANGGVNLSKFKFTEGLRELYTSSSAVTGLTGGVDFGFEIRNFTLATGVHYVQKGSQFETDNFEDDRGVGYYYAKERHHYLTVPIMVGYRKYFGDAIGLSIAIGPSISFGLGGKIDDRFEYFGTDEVDEGNFKVAFGKGVNDDYRPTQMGFRISPGLVFPLRNDSKLTFNVTWDLGTQDMYNPRYKNADEFFEFYDGDQRHRTTMFTIGYEYHFPFGDKY